MRGAYYTCAGRIIYVVHHDVPVENKKLRRGDPRTKRNKKKNADSRTSYRTARGEGEKG